MNHFKNAVRPLIVVLALPLAALVAGCGNGDGLPEFDVTPNDFGAGTGAGGLGRGPASVVLGAAGSFVILAETAITNVPTSGITGDVGLSPATGAGIDLTCPEVTGVVYDVDNTGPLACTVMDTAGLTAAIGAKGTAFTDAQGRAPDYIELGAGDIGGLNLSPATYKWGTGLLIPTDLTLTGGPNDVWIFQVAQDLTVSNGVQIILAGGALSKNIFWAVAAAELGTTSHFEGVILSQTLIAVNTGASINGRLLAGTAVTLQQNPITQPAP
jgi:hypothetical protein